MLRETLRTWAEAVAGLVYPEVCQICGEERAGPREAYVGASCRRDVRLIRAPFCERCGLPYDGAMDMPFTCANCHNVPLHFSYARSAAVAKGALREAIHSYKYNRGMWFEPFLAQLLIDAAVPVLRTQVWDLIVPVPLHRLREREREFNQAERLARRLGKSIGLAVDSKLMTRTEMTDTQARLSREERARNVRNAFAMRQGADVRGRRIVLVDDVLTTGATTSACARTLRKGGAEEVCVWTVARGLIH